MKKSTYHHKEYILYYFLINKRNVPLMTMTALAVKGDIGGGNIHSTNNNNNNNIKHFDNGGGNSKQITHSVDRHFNNNKFKLNNHNDNFNNKFNHNNDNFRFHNNNH